MKWVGGEISFIPKFANECWLGRCSSGLGKILVKKPRILSFRQLSVFWVKIGPKTKNNHLKVSMGIQVYNNITLWSALHKGQLIFGCHFCVFKSPKNQRNFSRISALASKKRSNKKIMTLYTTNWTTLFWLS